MGEILYLYWLFVKIGTFTFGGGYAMIPLFQTELVTNNHYLTGPEFADLVALAQITPGPVGLNAATYTGFEQAGILGALAGTLGVVTPAFVIVLWAAIFFNKFKHNTFMKAILYGIRPATIGLIAAAVIFFAEMSVFTAPIASLWKTIGNVQFGISWQALVVFAGVIVVHLKWKPNIIYTVLGSAALCVILGFL